MYILSKPDDYLVHHGVKGMKWGVRRTPEQLGRKRAQKSGVDERYVNKAVKQAYALNRKTNKSARQSKRQMRIEEELETYINTNRNPKKDAVLKRAIEKESQRSSGEKSSALKTTVKKARSARNVYRNMTGSKRSAAMTKYRKKNIDGMSDADLRKAVNRMNLERQYRDLTKADYMKGQRYASDILKYKSTMKRF
jgi:hypothetical protein